MVLLLGFSLVWEPTPSSGVELPFWLCCHFSITCSFQGRVLNFRLTLGAAYSLGKSCHPLDVKAEEITWVLSLRKMEKVKTLVF